MCCNGDFFRYISISHRVTLRPRCWFRECRISFLARKVPFRFPSHPCRPCHGRDRTGNTNPFCIPSPPISPMSLPLHSTPLQFPANAHCTALPFAGDPIITSHALRGSGHRLWWHWALGTLKFAKVYFESRMLTRLLAPYW